MKTSSKIDLKSGAWLNVNEVASMLGISLATFKRRLAELEYFREYQALYYEGEVKEGGFVFRMCQGTAVKFDRIMPGWRSFPVKEKMCRQYYWEKERIQNFLDRSRGVLPLP